MNGEFLENSKVELNRFESKLIVVSWLEFNILESKIFGPFLSESDLDNRIYQLRLCERWTEETEKMKTRYEWNNKEKAKILFYVIQ